MSEPRSLFSLRSQRAILWWGIALAVIYALAFIFLLQQVRDEAHRFAITFHRQRRSVAARESMFDQLDGVGPVRRRALLRHFGSAERLLSASPEELEGVPGVPAKTARQIYAQLHRAGPRRRHRQYRYAYVELWP